MALRIVNYVRSDARAPLERAVRQALARYPGELDVSISPAVDPGHAEILIKERGTWRATFFAPVALPVTELSKRIKASLAPAP